MDDKARGAAFPITEGQLSNGASDSEVHSTCRDSFATFGVPCAFLTERPVISLNQKVLIYFSELQLLSRVPFAKDGIGGLPVILNRHISTHEIGKFERP